VRRCSLGAALLLTAAGAGAQPAPRHRPAVPEARVDGFAGRRPGVQVGGGASIDAGPSVRIALLAGAGVQWRDDGITGVQHVEAIARYQLDPFREARRGVYLAGGVDILHVAGEPTLRPALVALIGLEGRPHGGVATALEAGVGGGVRVGLALRGTRRDRR
jgi:hypothetical protein